MTEWIAANPGPWQQDSAHTPTSQTAIMQETYPLGFNRGFSETFARYGLLLDRLAMCSVNGFTYHQPQPFDLPGPNGPMTAGQINAEFGRRLGVAEAALESKLWLQDLHDWDTDWKPKAIARHRALSDVSLPDLADDDLIKHIAEVAAHLEAMVYQHHRFNVAAVFPPGDFVLHASQWTGRPPHTLLAALNGYSPISGSLPDEMVSAIEAIRADTHARDIVEGAGDASQRLVELRAALPAVDEYVRSIDCRLIDAFDVISPTLREQPEMILGKLATGLLADADAARSDSDSFAAELRAEVPAENRAMYDELLEDARTLYRLRDERGIFSDVMAIGLLRLALVEVGRRAFQRGHVQDPEDVLDATIAEIQQALDGHVDGNGLHERGVLRRALTAAGPPRHLGPPAPAPPPADSLPPALARMMSGVGFMIDAILGQMEAAEGDASTIIGLGANGGVCTGKARIIGGIDDLLDLEEGEIVVAATTGEAFNAVLHLVAGIVTDHGSHACHAAIVAREIGFPAVVGTVNATSRIATGDRIRVDGTKGEVRILA